MMDGYIWGGGLELCVCIGRLLVLYDLNKDGCHFQSLTATESILLLRRDAEVQIGHNQFDHNWRRSP